MARRARKPLARPSAFWDASALVPLCIAQGISHRVQVLYNRYEVVVWWATPIEIAGALARLMRMQEIGSEDWVKARYVAAAVADNWSVIQPSNALRGNATKLVDRYDLKAGDALQLAAALEWCEDVPHGEVFLTGDQRLREAAVLSGFDGSRL
jgi:predicted nucleic acid-binding protein